MRQTGLRFRHAASLLLLFGPVTAMAQSVGWTVVRQTIKVRFPSVPQLSTEALASRFDGPGQSPLLFDVRSQEEYAVSHLNGARRLDPKTRDFAALDDLPRDTPIVTYCAVGMRSSAMAKRLMKAGFTRVANLDGSIFAWANQGRAVYRDGEVVSEVHPYDAVWGRLLDSRLHPDE